jgi:hypothetical protein
VFEGDPDEAYRDWSEMAATDWKHLLRAGGLHDQPEARWHDVLSIEFMNRRLKESREA